MEIKLFRLEKALMFGLEIEWEYGSVSLYFLAWELYIGKK